MSVNIISNNNVKKTSVYIYVSNSRLPSDYQEVEYLQSDGNQYIDSGIKLSSSDTVKCKFELTSIPTSYAEGVYGTMEQISGTNTFFVLLMRNPNLARVGTSSNQVSSNNVVINTIYDTTLSNGTYIENGTTYTFTQHSGFAFATNCHIFKRNQSAMTPIKGKIYSFEIVDKFNGIPCYRKSDGVAGLYDTISSSFFTNAGTGTFTVGDNVYSDGYHLQKVRVNLLSPTNNLLKMWRKEWSTDTKNPTDAVTFDYNKLYYMASSGYLRVNPGNLAETITRDYVKFTQTSSSWWGIGFPMEVKPNTKYTISATRNDGNKTKINYTLYNSDGTFGSYEQLTTNTSILDVSRTITTGANSKTLIVLVCGISTGDTVYAENIQVEEGQTKTDFKPYYREIINI